MTTTATQSRPPTTATGVEAPLSPYKGLVPFTEPDAQFFFGRDTERAIIAANLRTSRLTILYGESGTGKTSVLRAGVVTDLRRQTAASIETEGEPRYAVVVFSDWRDDPAADLARAIMDAVDGLVPAGPQQPAGGLSDRLREAPEQVGRLLVILDQFEEYFLYHHGQGDEGSFAEAFIEAVNDSALRVNFLVSIREDALAKLDVFQGEIPQLFDNYLRIEHLDAAAARSAIVEPVARYNEVTQSPESVVVEPELVEAVVTELEAGRVLVGEVGYGATPGAGSRVARIETPYLQLVMTRLWNEEMRSDSRALRLATLQRLGGAERIVATHLDEAMSVLSTTDRHLAASIFHHLVTPSGTKIAHTPSDLAAYVAASDEEIEPVLTRLAGPDVRILRPVPPPFGQVGETRFEIFHDVLAQVILDWRARYLKDRERADAVRQGVAFAVHAAAGFWWALITLGVLVVAIDEDPNYWYGFIWLVPAWAVWIAAIPILRRRWRRRQRILPAVLLTEVAALTAPLSFFVIGPVWLVRRLRRRRRQRQVGERKDRGA